MNREFEEEIAFIGKHDFNHELYRMIDSKAEELNIARKDIVKNLAIKQLAQEAAKRKVWGMNPELQDAFISIGNEKIMHLAKDRELFDILLEKYVREEKSKLNVCKARRAAIGIE